MTFIKFHPEELTSIYFGCRMQDKEMRAIQVAAKEINPRVKLFRSIIAPRKYEVAYELYS